MDQQIRRPLAADAITLLTSERVQSFSFNNSESSCLALYVPCPLLRCSARLLFPYPRRLLTMRAIRTRPIDEDYTAKIRKYTTDPQFNRR